MKKKFLVLLAALMIFSVFFTACLDGDDIDDTDDDAIEDNGGGSDTSVPTVNGTEPDMNADGVKFTNYGTYYAVTGYAAPANATNVALTIPATYKDLPVLVIGSRAFTPSAIETNKVITSITLPEGLVTIQASAFADCVNLTSINIPSTVTSIGRGAFARCRKLPAITIPAGCATLGVSVFESCTLLESIVVAPENPNYTSINGDLYNKDGTVLLRYAIGKGGGGFTPAPTVTTLGEGCLQGATFIEVVIPETLRRIEPTVFKDCKNLTSVKVTVPSGWYHTNYADDIGGSGINQNTVMKKADVLAKNLTDERTYLHKYLNRI